MNKTLTDHAGAAEVRHRLQEDDGQLGAAERPSPGAEYRPGIDGLRAVAVTLVVAFHAGVPFLPGGFIGVDVFFVISGFLITGLLVAEAKRNKRISMTAFYSRRARRLLPMATLVLATTVLATWFWMPSVW
jgi:peptidoglycan/LPS O-acetylase OafA/YrhL